MPVRNLRSFPPGCLAFLFLTTALTAKPVSPAGTLGPAAPAPVPFGEVAESSLEEPLYDTTTNPLPPNVGSIGYHGAATSEFGDHVRLAGWAHFVDSVTVTMSSWAIRSDYADTSPLGFTHQITLKLYDVDRSLGGARAGQVLATVTTPVLVPWRPAPDPAYANSPLRPWRAADGGLYGGLAFNVTFDLSAHVVALPEEVIFSVSFNTEKQGASPLGVPGPYNALNVGINVLPPTAGADLAPGAVYWKTADGTFYADEGNAGVNVFRTDTGWASYTPAVRFNNSPYGALAGLATGLMDLNGSTPVVHSALIQARKLAAAALDRTLWDGNRQVRVGWGRLVFDLLAESTDELTTIANSRDPIATHAQNGIDTLIAVATTLAEAALGDALIGGGDPRRVSRAQNALDAAYDADVRGRYDQMIDEFGNAWRESQLSLR